MQRMPWVRSLGGLLVLCTVTFGSLWMDAHLGKSPLPVKKKILHRLPAVTQPALVSFIPNFASKAQYRFMEPIALQRIASSRLLPDDDYPQDAAQPLIDTVLVVPKWFAAAVSHHC